MTVRILVGDCLLRMRELADNSVDSVVCDPPYHLASISKRWTKSPRTESTMPTSGPHRRVSRGFMGQTWDGGDVAFQPETWAEVLRVLKPGGMLAAFSGCRTYHRMVCAIEDAGFEVREMCSWNFGSGFPKSKNVFSDLAKHSLACTCPTTKLSSHNVSDENVQRLRESLDARDALSGSAEQDVRTNLRGVLDLASEEGSDQGSASNVRHLRDGVLSSAERSAARDGRESLLQPPLLGSDESGSHASDRAPDTEGAEPPQGASDGAQPGMEGRRLPQADARQLSGGEVSASAGMGAADGASGRLHHAASASNGADVRLPADADGSGESQGSRSGEQSSGEPGAVADERGSQAWGGWPLCDGCRKPIIPEGLGSALKPAFEPICLARKPLSEKSIAANVLKWGTGALNIDGCRVDSEKPTGWAGAGAGGNTWNESNMGLGKDGEARPVDGRWPANLVHDGSDEVLVGFPITESNSGEPFKRNTDRFRNTYGAFEGQDAERGFYGDSGSAARFFYCAKATTEERGEGNNHPTVKPVALMQWLVRLVTPKGGTVLDPFLGSGSTGIAADAEQFNFIGCELSGDYAAIAEQRIRKAAGLFAVVEIVPPIEAAA